MLKRPTQTNELARCATLLPALARPATASANRSRSRRPLCLLPDRYAYTFGDRRVAPADAAADAPQFRCLANPATPVPTELPRISWRAGLDLSPLDLDDAAAVRWLETLVWPGQDERHANLIRAIAVARDFQPAICRPTWSRSAPEAPRMRLSSFFTAVLAWFNRRLHAMVDGRSAALRYHLRRRIPRNSALPETAVRAFVV
jgi:hypothetical protein